MAYRIDLATTRKQLSPRANEPYWGSPLGRGRALGFRKIAADKGSWIARMRSDDSSKKYVYEPLGFAVELDYTAAKEAAEQWFKLKADGISTHEVETVEDACRAYVKERRASKSPGCAHDAEKRFERTAYGKPFGRTPLAKLRAARIREWRDGLGLSPGSANRTLTALKAALNLAAREKQAPAALMLELRLVKPLPGGKKRRDLYLDLKQRRALLKTTKGALRDLLEGVALTGARAGELTNAVVSQFDARTQFMTFITNKGNDGPRSRTVPVSPAAVKLFTRLTEGKTRTDRILQRDDGQPWAHSDWDELVREAAKAAELPAEPRTGVCLYTLRHCFITDALLGGIPTLEVARLVGTSVAMIEKHYGHLVASAARKRLAKVAML
ncbi:MAG: tyrosine-type recombinase/integrase [Steroidobacteraceae bacterium]